MSEAVTPELNFTKFKNLITDQIINYYLNTQR